MEYKQNGQYDFLVNLKEALESGLHGRYVFPPNEVLEKAKALFNGALEVGRAKHSYHSANISEYCLIADSIRKADPSIKRTTRVDLGKRIERLATAINGLNGSGFEIEPEDANLLIGICNEITRDETLD
jgi:hypothetical protein